MDLPESLSLFVAIFHTSCVCTEDKFLLDVHHLHVRVKETVGERRFWVRPYFSSYVLFVFVSSAEKDIKMRLDKAWTAFDWLPIKGKSDLSDKIKRNLFQAAVVSILLYSCRGGVLVV